MKWIALAVIFAATVAVGLFMFVMWSRAAGEVASFREGGVCIDAPSSDYSIEATMPVDFWLVDVGSPNGGTMRVYIGNYPQVEDADIEAGRAARGAFVPVSGTNNQFVAVEPEEGQVIVHAMVSGQNDRERLLEGVRFCGDPP